MHTVTSFLNHATRRVKPKPGAMDDSHAQGQPPAKKLKDAHPTPAAAQQTTTYAYNIITPIKLRFTFR